MAYGIPCKLCGFQESDHLAAGEFLPKTCGVYRSSDPKTDAREYLFEKTGSYSLPKIISEPLFVILKPSGVFIL